MLQSNTLIVHLAFGDDDQNNPEDQKVNITETPEFQEALKAQLSKALESETSGLKAKLSEALGEKKKSQGQLNAILAQIEDEKDQADLKAGKIDHQAIVDKKIAARDKSWQEKFDASEAEKGDLRKSVEAAGAKLKAFQIKQFVVSEALKNEFFHASAAEDVAQLAAGLWDLNEDGEIYARDKDGNVALGKDGRPLTAKEWVEDLHKSRPHYFKNMAGSGSKPGSGSAVSMTLHEYQQKIFNGTEQEAKELRKKRESGLIHISDR